MDKPGRGYQYIIFFSAALIGLASFFYLYPRFGWETFSWSGADAAEYNLLADNLAGGHGFSLRISEPYVPSAARMPGYPAIVAASKIAFGSVVPVIILQILTYAMSAVITYKIARMFLSGRLALVAGFLVVLHIYIAFMALSLMTETFFIASMSASVYFLLRYFEMRQTKLVIFSVLVLGFSALLRPTSLYLIAVWMVMILWGTIRNIQLRKPALAHAGLALLIFAAVLAPWSIRNKVEFGRWDLVSANSFGFYAATPVYLTALADHISQQDAKAVLLKKFESAFQNDLARDANYPDFAYKGYDKFEYGDWFGRESAMIVKKHFGLFVKEIIVSAPEFFTKNLWLHPFEKYNIVYPAYQPLVPIRRVWTEQGMSGLAREISARFLCGPSCVLSFGIVALGRIFYIFLAVFGFLGICVMLRDRAILTRRAGLFFLLIIGYFTAVHAILTAMAGHERYRLPIVPLMIAAALFGASAVLRKAKLLTE